MTVSMEQGNILSLDSINRIRFYVKTKYSHLPKEEHATIVADAIVKIIERQLPNFSSEVKKEITNKLVEQIIIPLKRPVSIDDIYQASAEATLDDDDRLIFDEWQADQGLVVIPKSLWQRTIEVKAAALAAIHLHRKRIYYGAAYMLLAFTLFAAFPYIQAQRSISLQASDEPIAVQTEAGRAAAPLMDNELPAMYQYSDINVQRLQQYLESRNSMLTDEPYFNAIIDAAYSFNIHPALLFAITGQEQGFVDRDNAQASKIVNNPFNVFHSWELYNTTTADSAEIAARTLVNLSKERPADVDAITWINRKYAEDPNWSDGVRSLFNTIINYIND